MKLQFIVSAENDGKTIKQVLAEKGYSTELVKKFKYDGEIAVNGKHCTVRQVLKVGDVLTLVANENALHPAPADIPAEVVYADEYLYVATKPYGINTHPDLAHREGTLANGLSAYFGEDFALRIVTRLDRTTSGLVLGALDPVTAEKLNAMQLRHEIAKQYVAVVCGVPSELNGEINLPLLRDDEHNKTIVAEGGKPSVTEYRVIATMPKRNLTVVALTPHTGRTHQLRAHLAAVGCPILGDVLYGGTPADRIYLHCRSLDFAHPVTGKQVSVTSEIPWHLQ